MDSYLDLEKVWKVLDTSHVEKYGYSGAMIRALCLSTHTLRSKIVNTLNIRKSTLEKLENTDRISAKFAKQLALIFNLQDWKVLREKDKYISNIKQNIKCKTIEVPEQLVPEFMNFLDLCQSRITSDEYKRFSAEEQKVIDFIRQLVGHNLTKP
jgi:hypothetical protein